MQVQKSPRPFISLRHRDSNTNLDKLENVWHQIHSGASWGNAVPWTASSLWECHFLSQCPLSMHNPSIVMLQHGSALRRYEFYREMSAHPMRSPHCARLYPY